MVKLLHTETMRGGTRVFFLAGNRVVDKLSISYDVEKQLTKLLRYFTASDFNPLVFSRKNFLKYTSVMNINL